MYKISVITICRDEERRVGQTLSSIATQSFTNFEWIFIDGGSRDGTLATVEPYRRNFHHFVSEPDLGVFHAQNKGAVQAHGEYLLFLNAGDFLSSPDSLAILAAAANGEDFIYGDMMIVNREGQQRYGKAPVEVTLDYMLTASMWHPATLIKRALFESIGPYDEDFKIVSDYDFFMKALFQRRTTLKYVAKPVATFHEDGLASRPEYFELHQRERRVVQDRYLAPLVLKYYESQVELQKKPAFLARNLLKQCAKRGLRLAPQPIQSLVRNVIQGLVTNQPTHMPTSRTGAK
jgi:glycosyltransferase involved in cell wall biosynthesis